MGSLSDPVGFDLDDALTRVLPGAVFVFSTAIVIDVLNWSPNFITYDPFSTSFITIGIILSFLFGELIELFRHQKYRTPRPFNRLIYRSTYNEKHLYLRDRVRVLIYKRISKNDPSEIENPESGYFHNFFYAPWMNEKKILRRKRI